MGKYGHYEFYNKFIGLNFIWRMDNMAQIVGRYFVQRYYIEIDFAKKKLHGFFSNFQRILI